MSISYKERMRRAVQHEAVDRIPTQINYTPSLGEKMAQHFGISLEELPDRLGNHFLRVDLSYEKRLSTDGETAFDWWGAGFSTTEEGYFTTVNPLAESKDLDAYAWPDPQRSDLLDEAAKKIAADGGKHFIAPNFGFALFERAWSLRGFDNLLMELATDPEYVGELMDRITDIQHALILRYLDLGVDGGYFGDDYGAQKNLLFSPRTWRKLIKPRLAKLFAPFREAGLPVIMHSDGDIGKILPDLVEIGLTVYNPVQPEVHEHRSLKERFGTDLAYYGGLSTQTVLPNGTPEEVKEAARACVRDLAPDNTGLLLAPSHRMMTDIPLANIEAMLEAFKELGETS